MTYTATNNFTNSNDTTDVTIVSAPSSGQQHIIPANNLTIYNADTVSAEVVLKIDKNGTEYIIEVLTLSPGETMYNSTRIILDATDEVLQIVLTAAVTTNQLDVVVSYGVHS